MAFRVVDEAGRAVGFSRDLEALSASLGVRAKGAFGRLDKSRIERDRVTAWDFGDLPASIEIAHGSFALRAYPGLAVEGDGVALRVFPTEGAAHAAHRAGLRRLYALRLGDVVKYVRRNLPGIQGMTFSFALLGSGDDLKDDLIGAAIDKACIGEGAQVRTASAFEESAARARGELAGAANRVCEIVAPILSAYQDATRSLPAPVPKDPYADVREHLASLVYRGFVASTPWARLPHLPRYLKAVQLRIERMQKAPQKDRERAGQIAPLVRQYQERAARRRAEGRFDPELERYRWLLEEWRVSLFAQELKTAEPVSEKRLAEQWARVPDD
jgi:ATP-dependent helicase HrpA